MNIAAHDTGMGPSGRRRAAGGLSLVEVMVVTVILGILGLAIGSLFIGSAGTQTKGLALVNLQWEYSMALERMGRVLRDAKWATVDSGGTYVDFYTPTGATVTQGRLTRQGSALVITRGSEVDKDLRYVQALSFAPYAGRVAVNLQLSMGGESVPENGPGRTMVEMRNRVLAAQWDFNEGGSSGEAFHDRSGRGSHGTCVKTSWVAGPQSGYALRFTPFDGSYAMVPGSSALNVIAAERAVFEFHLKPTLSGSTSLTLYSRGDVMSDAKSLWIYIRRSNGEIVFRSADDTSRRTIVTGPLTWESGRWYRVRVVADSVGKTVAIWRAYTKTTGEAGAGDPLEVDEMVGTGSLPRALAEGDTDAAAYIGRARYLGVLDSNTAYNGDIDEIVISTY